MPSREKLLELIAVQTDVARLGLDLRALLALVAQRCLALAEADGAVVELVGGDTACRASAGGFPEGSLTVLDGLALECLRQGRAQRCDDALHDPRTHATACAQLGLQSLLVVPMRHQGEPVALLKLVARQPGRFDDATLAVLEMLSDPLGAALYFAAHYAPAALFHQATHDGLTDLPNRALFLDRLRASLSQAVRDGQPLAVMMLDMNGLKPINDHFGHRAGDAALLEFSRRLSAGVRQSDTAARLGGDEFGVLLRPLAARGGLEATMERLQRQFNGSFQFEGRTLPVGASMGAARFPEDGSDVSQLIELADRRMYEHKRAHQNVLA